MSKVFFAAYPANPNDIGLAIESAAKIETTRLEIRTWKQSFGPGSFIDQGVLPEIRKADGLLVDVSYPNNNVFFEAGYAIGLGKPIIPICNSSENKAGYYLKSLGLFDNIGYQTYENGADLRHQLDTVRIPDPLFRDDWRINKKQPVYLLDALKRSEFAAKVVSAVKDSIKFFRSYDPNEEYRMSMRVAWESVSQSSGVLVTILSENKEDSLFHNLRASLLAGLAFGIGREYLILKDGLESAPLDFIDNCYSITHPDDISEHINAFGVKALRALHETPVRTFKRRHRAIEKVSLGSAAAENEFRDLADYFIDTAEYRSALNGNGRIVVGRKGSGKTAIFWRVRDTVRTPSYSTCVVDLKPDGYQLRKFKEILVKQLSQGTKEHTLTAFWEYLIYGELIYKLFEDDFNRKYGRDPVLTAKLDKLKVHYNAILEGREGDFSERMMSLLDQVSDRFKSSFGMEERDKFLTSEEVTGLIYKSNIYDMQNATLDYLRQKQRSLVLVDNIDKAWGAYGVDSDDVLIVRTLLEALKKISRQASRKEVDFDWLVFLRNDVFEHLINEQSDRGKEDRIVVDWDSPSALRQVVEERIRVSSQQQGNDQMAWSDIATPLIDGVDSLTWLVQRSLMRPRHVIQLVQECIGHALTSQHNIVEEIDLREGYRLYSLDVVGNTNFEVRDVFPPAYDAIYCLIGLDRRTSLSSIRESLRSSGYAQEATDEIIRYFFWFGVLGTEGADLQEKYIYDYRYDEKIFHQTRTRRSDDDETVFINLAFSSGLGNRY